MQFRRIRVLQVFGVMNRGGAELRSLDMLRRMDRGRFTCDFWAVSSKRGELDDEIRHLGGEVYYAQPGAGRWPSLMQQLIKSHYDVVHSNVYYRSGFVLALAAMAGAPMRIAHFHTTKDEKGDSIGRRMYRRSMRHLLNRYATTVLGASEGALQANWGVGWSRTPRCQVIYGGVDCQSHVNECEAATVRTEFGFRHDCVLVLHVGRLTAAKNHERLLSIFATLARDDHRYRLVMAGAKEHVLGDHLRVVVKRLGLEAKVVFAGVRADVPRLFAAANIMIFPSIWEGLPGAVVEAAAAGVPVVTSDIPGCVELTRYTDMVRCLPLEKSDAEWAAATKLLLPQRRSTAPQLSPLAGTVFDAEVSTRSFEQLYARALNRQTRTESVEETNGQCSLP